MKKILICFLIITAAVFLASAAAGAVDQNNDLNSIYIYRNASTGDLVDYQLLIKNRDQSEHKYKLQLIDLPEKYSASLDYSAADNNFTVAAGKGLIKNLRIKIPAAAGAEEVFFKTNLIRDDGQQQSIGMALKIDRDYQLIFSNYPQNLNLISGQNKTITLTAANTGGKDLKNISLKFDLPHKWLIENVKPQTMNLKAGEKGVFEVDVFVPSSQAAGNKEVSVTASSTKAEEGIKISPVTVQKNPSFFLIIIFLLILVVIGTIYYFRKFGRR